MNSADEAKILRLSVPFLLSAMLAVLAGCGSGTLTSTTPTTTIITAATLSLSATPTRVPSDNSLPTTVTVTALSATNAVVPAVVVTLAADTGILSAQTVTTGSDGTATFTFRSGTTSLANRTATIVATATGATAQIPVQIVGSTLTVFAGSVGTVPDDGSSPLPITFVARNVQGTGVANAPFSVASTGLGLVTLTPTSGVTDADGKFVTTVAGVAGGTGTATVTATAVGSTAAATITVSPALTTFAISQTVNGSVTTPNPTAVSMTTADSLVVTASVPAPHVTVTFATSIGTWTGGTTILENVPVVVGVSRLASATLTTASAGVATVQALVPNTILSDSLTVSMTAVTPAAITLQATPSVVPKSVGTTTGVSTLVATVVDSTGQPVGNAPVAFSMLNPTGGGETVSPVVAYTAATAGGGLTLGQALASFTSGSLTSGAGGVQVRATVLGTTVQTEAAGVNLTTSGNDAAITIGGTAGSVAFGTATVLLVNSNATAYIQAMSVLVADVSGAPAPKGTLVNISLWPVAWSTGSSCSRDSDFDSTHGTFLNEDENENVTLDPLEDGSRKYYASGSTTTTSFTCDTVTPFACTNGAPVTSLQGTVDTQITPPNSAAGTLTSTNPLDLPGTVTTDASGIGAFNLTYGKNSAIWTVVRIRARTLVAGSDAAGEIRFRLLALESDVTPKCILPPSPYQF